MTKACRSAWSTSPTTSPSANAPSRRLRESEHRYRTLFEMNPLPMWVYDLETLRFTAVNDAAVAHYGYSARRVPAA